MAPRSPAEELLSGIWAEVLQLPRVGVKDDFFALGGHSLLATRIVSRIRSRIGRELPLRALFEVPTVSALARRMEGVPERIDPDPIRPRLPGAPLPLSFAQQRLWFLQEMDPKSTAYNMAGALRLKGPLDITALERSLGAVITRQEALRTRFPAADGTPRQAIDPPGTELLRIEDLSALPDSERNARCEALLRQDAERPFDLSAGPLYRFRLIRFTGSEHLLSIVLHHMVADGWSLSILLQELGSLYNAFQSGAEPDLAAPPVQYGDFALWQRDPARMPRLERQLDYWRNALAGAPVLELPTDRPRPAVQTSRGALCRVRIDEGLTRAVRKFSLKEGVTPFMTLLAAFQLLLGRYSRTDDVSVGSPVAGRLLPELDGLIGCFINNLVLRTRLDRTGFRSLLTQVRETTLAAYQHQDVPFEQLVDALAPERDTSRSPLFQVMFAFQNLPLGQWASAGLEITPLETARSDTPYDLSLVLEERGETIEGGLSYRCDLWDAATMERMAGHYATLLGAAVADPDAPLSDLAMITVVERETLTRWSTGSGNEIDALLHRRFEEQAARTPEALALVGEQDSSSYETLNRRANQVALALKPLPLEARVGLCLDRSSEMVAALLGVLKAGGAYVPLDPTLPPGRLAAMIADAGIGTVVTRPPFAEKLPTGELRRIDLDALDPSVNDPGNPGVALSPDHLAYVLYTSGSTGVPKGVACHHRGVANLLADFDARAPLRAGQRCSLWTSFTFDVSVYETFSALLNGAALEIVPEAARLDEEALFRWLRDRGIAGAYVPPFMVAGLARAVARTPGEFALTRLLVGVEPIPERILTSLCERLPHLHLVNGYGPTEATVCATLYSMSNGRTVRARTPIGKPVRNLCVYLLDPALHPVPAGVPGEIFIGGAGLARGYVGRPGMTAERFVPDPFAAAPGGRLYRTGDLGRWLPDGNIEYIGREDFQLKLHGLRIEAGEIEAALERHPDVDDAVVVLREDHPGRRRLVAYVLSQSESLDAAGLRAVSEPLLPAYMMPETFIVLRELPVTSSGKVDRIALPAPAEADPARCGLRAAESDAERILADIWEEVLGCAGIGMDDNFFTLGGDSILMIRIVSRARERGLHLTPQMMFRHQTIAELAPETKPRSADRTEQGPVTGSSPLTPVQAWFFEQGFADPHHWNQSLMLSLGRPLDPRLAGRALEALFFQHDALRSVFVREGDHWRQHYRSEIPGAPFQVKDLAALPPDRQADAMAEHAALAQASLDLERGPLFRAVLYRLEEGCSHRLLLIAHHLVVDAVSWRILLEDFQTAYGRLERGETATLPVKSASFKQWAERLPGHGDLPRTRSAAAFWLDRTVPAVRLPLDNPGGSNREASACTIRVSLDEPSTEALQRGIHAVYNTRINDLLLSGLALTLASWLKTPAVRLDLEGHGREPLFEDLDLSRTVGWFTTLTPVVLTVPPDGSPGQTLIAVKEYLRALPEGGLDYGLLRHLCADGRVRDRMAALPQSEISFNFFGQVDAGQTAPGLFTAAPEPAGPMHAPDALRPYVLEISAAIESGRLQVQWTYGTELHVEATIRALAEDYLSALRRIVAHCQSPAAGAYTPSDFPEAELTREGLQDLLDELSGPDKTQSGNL